MILFCWIFFFFLITLFIIYLSCRRDPDPPLCDRPPKSMDPPGVSPDGLSGDRFMAKLKSAVSARKAEKLRRQHSKGRKVNTGGQRGKTFKDASKRKDQKLLPWDAVSSAIVTFSIVASVWMVHIVYTIMSNPKPDESRLWKKKLKLKKYFFKKIIFYLFFYFFF